MSRPERAANRRMPEFASFDWSRTPLGPRDTWSEALNTVYDLMMSAHVAMCAAWGPKQTFLYNAAYAPFLGARHPAALGQDMPDVWPELWPEIGLLIEQAMAGERVQFIGHHLVMTRNGQPEDTWWDFSYSPLRDRGEVVGFLNVATEATQHVMGAQRRDAAAAALRSQNSDLEQQVSESAAALTLYRNIVQSTRFPICAYDTEQRVIAFNQAHADEWLRVMGYPARLGQVLPEAFTPEQAALQRAFADRALAGEEFTVEGEFGDARLEIPHWELDYAPIRDRAGGIIGAFHHARDVTARVKAVADLAKAEEALRQSQKMEAVGQLTGGLAHDFNNLLTGISGSLELLSTRIGQGRLKDLDRYVSAAQGAAKRAAALTHRLLAFSRRQTLDPKPTDVNRVVGGMEELVRRTIGPSIELAVVMADGLWPTLVDPSQLENALLNLCINARDAMPDGGRLTVETTNRVIDDRTAHIYELPTGQYVTLSVSDTGTGMPPDVIAKAFDPFFTTKPLGQGTGLGLSMIYGFTRQSGGQVRIHSEVGQGTNVSLHLPRYLGEAEVAEALPDLADAPRAARGETVLVVDDEPTVRMLVAEVLEELGYGAIEASDGATGLRVLRSNARVDLLVTDVGLPGGMNGRQLADAARVTRPGLKVLFITGYAENAVVGDGHLDPGMQVMTKPFAMESLASRIREMIAIV